MSDAIEQAAEIKRLTKILRKQGAEKRRLAEAYAKLKDEKRSVHEILAMAETLQDEIDRLEAMVTQFTSGGRFKMLEQAARDAKGSRAALSVRYGHLHAALRAVAPDHPALRDVDDRDWMRDNLPVRSEL